MTKQGATNSQAQTGQREILDDAATKAVAVAKKIAESYTGMASIDTADEDECAFIFAAVNLVQSHASTAEKIGQLMDQPKIKFALWGGEQE